MLLARVAKKVWAVEGLQEPCLEAWLRWLESMEVAGIAQRHDQGQRA